MKVLLTNTSIFLGEVPKELEDEISTLLSFKVPGARYTSVYKRKFWDGYKRFYNRRTKKCDAGFLEIIMGAAEEYGQVVVIEDARSFVKRRSPFSPEQWSAVLQRAGITPHAYISRMQAKAAKKGLRSYIEDGVPWPRGIFEIATGGGKTLLAANLINTVNKKTLYLVNRLHLMYQTEEAMYEVFKSAEKERGKLFSNSLGIIGDSTRKEEKVTLVMLHTAAQLLEKKDPWFLEFLDSIELLLIDEAHHLNDNTYYEVAKHCKNAYYRYALTATPLKRGDPGDAQLLGVFGSPIVRVKSKTLRDKGALADVKAWVVRFTRPKIPQRNIKQAKSRGIHRNVDRHKLIVSIAKRFEEQEWPCLILVDQPLVHGETLKEIFWELLGRDIPLVNFHTSLPERAIVLSELERGLKPCIIASVGVFGEGVDAPNIRALIRAEGGDSEIRSLQAAGRGMRRKPPPNILYLVDIYDETNAKLERESQKRVAIYDEEQYSLSFISGAKDITFPEK